jgi:hypothetical protein
VSPPLFTLQRSLELPEEHFRIDRLDQMLVEAGGERTPAVLRRPAPGHCNETRGSRRAALAQHADGDIAVAVRKPDVAEHDVRLELRRCLEPFLAGVRDHDLEAAHREQPAHAFGAIAIVFHHQDSERVHEADCGQLRELALSPAPAMGRRAFVKIAVGFRDGRFPSGLERRRPHGVGQAVPDTATKRMLKLESSPIARP